jgi:hypothetical protein
MANINSVLRKAKRVLVCDCDNFNKDIPDCKSLVDVRDALNLNSNTRLVKIREVANRHEYRVVNSTYTFELLIL